MKLLSRIALLTVSCIALVGCSVDRNYDLNKDIDNEMTLFPGMTLPINQTLDTITADEFLDLGINGLEVPAGESVFAEYVLDLESSGFDFTDLDILIESFEVEMTVTNTVPLRLNIQTVANDGSELKTIPSSVEPGTPDSPKKTSVKMQVETKGEISSIREIKITLSASNESASTVKVTADQGVSIRVEKIKLVSGITVKSEN